MMRFALLILGVAWWGVLPARADEAAEPMPRCGGVLGEAWWKALRGRSVELSLRDGGTVRARLVEVTPFNVTVKPEDGGAMRVLRREDVARARPIGTSTPLSVDEAGEPGTPVPAAEWPSLGRETVVVTPAEGFPFEAQIVAASASGAVLRRPGGEVACAIDWAEVKAVERPARAESAWWSRVWKAFRDRDVVVTRSHGEGLAGRFVDGTGGAVVLVPAGGGEAVRVSAEEVARVTAIPGRSWGPGAAGPAVQVRLRDGARLVGRLAGYAAEDIEVIGAKSGPGATRVALAEVDEIVFGPSRRARMELIVDGPDASAEKFDACHARLVQLGAVIEFDAPVRLWFSLGDLVTLTVSTREGVVRTKSWRGGSMRALCEEAFFLAADVVDGARTPAAPVANALAPVPHRNVYRSPSPPPPPRPPRNRTGDIIAGVTVGVVLGGGAIVGMYFLVRSFASGTIPAGLTAASIPPIGSRGNPLSPWF